MTDAKSDTKGENWIEAGFAELARTGIDFEIQRTQTTLAVRYRAIEQLSKIGSSERLKHIDTRPRQERIVDLE